MISVYQCMGCRTIVGDTDVQNTLLIKGEEGIEISHVANFENLHGRIKCETCKETIGTEDEEGRIFFMPSKVTRYVVQSAKPSSANKRNKRSDSQVVSAEEFAAFKQMYDKDMSDCKETIMVLFERLEKLE